MALTAIHNISYNVARIGLIMYKNATKHEMNVYKPELKFNAVTLILFLAYWQRFFMSYLPFDQGLMDKYSYFIICFEMLIFAILQNKAFPYWEYKNQVITSQSLHNISIADINNIEEIEFLPSESDVRTATISMQNALRKSRRIKSNVDDHKDWRSLLFIAPLSPKQKLNNNDDNKINMDSIQKNGFSSVNHSKSSSKSLDPELIR